MSDTNPTALTPEREQQIRTLDLLKLMSDRAAPVISGHLAALLAEVDRLRAKLAAQVAETTVEHGLSDGSGNVFVNWPNPQHVDRLVRGGAVRVTRTVTPWTDAAESAELTEGRAGLEAMRRQHPAPCRVPDSPDCTCLAETDTLPAWLHWRFGKHGQRWDTLTDDDKSYWEHQARAVRRAVARGGFKRPDVTDKAGAPTQ